MPQQIGRAELGEDPWGPHRSEFHINVTRDLGRGEDDVQESIREVLSGIPGITHDITTFLGDRVGETISGEAAEVVVSLSAHIYDISNACLGVINGIFDIANRIELGQIRAGMVVSCESSREINDVMIGKMLEKEARVHDVERSPLIIANRRRERVTLPALIAGEFRAQIETRVLHPGDQLPGHRDIAASYAVSLGSALARHLRCCPRARCSARRAHRSGPPA